MLIDHTRKWGGLGACAALLLHSAGAPAAAAEIPPPVVVAAAIAPEGAFAASKDPRGALWARVAEAEVELKLAPPVHPSIALSQHAAAPAAASPLPIRISALTDRRRLYLRLRWKDQTHDDRRATGIFPDAAAVEVPFAATETSVMMGSPDRPVAIWRWDAATNAVEALAAGSPGTLTRSADGGLTGSGAYRELGDAASSEWCVVIAHDLDAAGENPLDLRKRKRFPAAFAIWQGSDGQRGGYKRVSDWVSVQLPD